MTDIIERLRENPPMASNAVWAIAHARNLEAADELERVYAKLAEAEKDFDREGTRAVECLRRARKAEATLARIRAVVPGLADEYAYRKAIINAVGPARINRHKATVESDAARAALLAALEKI